MIIAERLRTVDDWWVDAAGLQMEFYEIRSSLRLSHSATMLSRISCTAIDVTFILL